MDDSNELIRKRFSSIAAPKTRKNKILRPSKRLLRTLHLIREHASVVAYRPISFENEGYLLNRTTELAKLRDQLLSLSASSNEFWKGIAANISLQINHASKSLDQQGFALVVHLCNQSGYQSYFDETISLIPFSGDVLNNEVFKQVRYIFGPAMGLGDEISSAHFVNSIFNTFPKADHSFYSFCPGIWGNQFPGQTVYQLEGEPDAAINMVADLYTQADVAETLVVFVNFSGIEFYRLFSLEKQAPTILEVSIGKGKLWLQRAARAPVEVLEALDSVLPNNYMALNKMSTLLGFSKEGENPVSDSKSPVHPFVITVNPFTSKEILLTPKDWTNLIGDALEALTIEGEIRLQLLPGMTDQSGRYALELKTCLQKHLKSNVVISTVNNGQALPREAAYNSVYQVIKNSNLVLGVDTYTAHLANLLDIPSLAICYYRNSAFWAGKATSFWSEISRNVDLLSGVLGLLMSLTLDGLYPTSNSGVLDKSLDGAGFSKAYHEFFDDPLDSIKLGQFVDQGDHLWLSLSKEVRETIIYLDKDYSWDKISVWLKDTSESNREWMRDMVSLNHFTKVGLLIN